MSNLNFNKMAAGVLCGGLLLMGGVKLGEILIPHQQLAENAYPFDVAEATATGGTSASAAPAEAEPIAPLLASADIAAGQSQSRKCTACHTFDKGGANRVGPNLYDIVNRSFASTPDFKYSKALAEHGGSWTYDELNHFLFKPKAWISGTKMNFAGLKKTKDRANIIAWMRTLSDNPAPLP